MSFCTKNFNIFHYFYFWRRVFVCCCGFGLNGQIRKWYCENKTNYQNGSMVKLCFWCAGFPIFFVFRKSVWNFVLRNFDKIPSNFIEKRRDWCIFSSKNISLSRKSVSIFTRKDEKRKQKYFFSFFSSMVFYVWLLPEVKLCQCCSAYS